MQLTFDIPEDAQPSKCRGCGETVYWIITRNGKRMPVDPDGTSHFATCPSAERYRRPKSKQA